jgi:hypothetical protein
LATPSAQVPRWTLLLIGVLLAAVLVLSAAWWRSTRAPADVTASPALVERPVPLPEPTIASPPPPAERTTTLRTPPSPPAPSAGDNALATAAAPTAPEPTPEAPSFAEPPAGTAAEEPALPSVAALLAEGILLPEMRLELLAFREQPRDRFVFINGRKYVEGDRLVEGPQLVSIAQTGAVLIHSGRRFLLVAE